jgi:hypothetical protein
MTVRRTAFDVQQNQNSLERISNSQIFVITETFKY